MSRRLRILFLVLIAIAATTATLGIVFLSQNAAPAPSTATRGVGGPFALTDQNGKQVTQADFSGRYMMIFFGFTNCPDVCPLTLQRIADALAEAPDVAKRIVPILISVDPERDTPEKLKDYVAFFGPSFQGLTGTPEQIAALVKSYGVYAKKVPLPDSALEYTVDHSSFIYLYGPDASFVTVFDPSLEPEALAAKLKETIK
jgi:protein SCO1/2